MKTKVRIETFKKGSGKWYSDLAYESSFSCSATEEILKEAKSCVSQDMDYTVQFANGEQWNKYLIKAVEN